MDALAALGTALAGRYTLERELGRGGMATVWLAEDVRHGRRVAVKVLHPDLAAVLGAERFLAEIRTTAALQHPHILPLFDSGEAGGHLYYVMPYVEGETLRARLEREHVLPVDDAVRLAREVASALDYAHRHGVIHRDVKPENVLLHDGRALVADFGIALAVQTAGGARMTQTGISLGTPQYMAPEQATGEKTIDARADVYALGAVTYEMLAGQPPFTAATIQGVIAKLMTEDPAPLAPQRRAVPPHVERAVLTALEKLPADRWATAAEFGAALEGGSRPSALGSRRVAAGGREPRAESRWPRALHWLLTLLALGGAAVATLSPRPTPERPARRWTLTLPDSAPLAFGASLASGLSQVAFVLSPDGSRLVYKGRFGATSALYIRRTDGYEVARLPGTEGATGPFFSPDGRWVAFFVVGELRKVSLETGEVVSIGRVSVPVGGAWGPGDRIYVSDIGGMTLFEVPAGGGGAKRTVATSPVPSFLAPAVLPGGRWLLHETRQRLAVTNLTTGESRVLTARGPLPSDSAAAAQVGSMPRWLASGHLAFVSPQGALFVAPFDRERLALTGPAVMALPLVRRERAGWAQYAVASDGTLAYVEGGNAEEGVLVWAGRGGRLDTLPLPPANYQASDVSPDGRRIAVRVVAPTGDHELWIYDLGRADGARAVGTRLLAGPQTIGGVVWTPDGRFVIRDLQRRVVVRLDPGRAGAVDTVHRMGLTPSSIAPDGRTLAGTFRPPDDDHVQVQLLPLDAAGRAAGPARRLTNSPAREYQPAFSPDGHWIAYGSADGGVIELYVEPFPGPGARTKLTSDGGREPVWARSGRELFFRNGARFLSVPVTPGAPEPFGTPSLIVEGAFGDFQGRSFSAGRDGRLLLKQTPAIDTTRTIRVVTDWLTEVRRLTSRQGR